MALKGVKVNGTTYPFDYDCLDNKPVIDSALSGSSTNAVQNKAVKAALDSLGAALGGDKSPVIIDTASGSVASFTDGADDMPCKSVVAQIEPVQDLHGYDNPWPAGGGKNKLSLNALGITSDSKFVVDGDNDAHFISPLSAYGSIKRASIKSILTSGTAYRLSASSIGSGVRVTVEISGATKSAIAAGSLDNTFTPIYSESDTVELVLFNFDAISQDAYIEDLMLMVSAPDTTYSPYSNICPISGHTGLTLSHSGADTSDHTTLAVSWQTEAGTVYGGTLDVVSGVLTVTMASVDLGTLTWMYNTSPVNYFATPITGKKPGFTNLICSDYPTNGSESISQQPDKTIRGAGNANYAFVKDSSYTDATTFQTAMSGVQLVYALETPQTYNLTPHEIDTLLGDNNIWTDTGNVSVSYPADTKLYIDRKIAEATA